MKTYSKQHQTHKEFDDVNVKVIELNLDDFIALQRDGVIFEEDYIEGKIVQVNCIVLRMKVEPNEGFFKFLRG